MPDELNGKDYRAVMRLSNGDDDVTYAEAGETCERVPVESLPGLLIHGYIALVQAPAADVSTQPIAAYDLTRVTTRSGALKDKAP